MADTDIADLRKRCIESLMLCTDNVLKYLERTKEEELGKLKKTLQGYCTLEVNQKLEDQAVIDTRSKTNVSNLTELESSYLDCCKKLKERHRIDIQNNPFIQQFEIRVRNSQVPAACDLNGSDIAFTETPTPFIDPITKRPIQDPLRNSICNHVYEREAIVNHIQRKSKAMCPVGGCGNRTYVLMTHLVCDEELRLLVAARQSADMDVDPL